MPLVKIDMIKGVRSPEEIKKLADVVQEIMLAKFAAPPRDRYQVNTPSSFLHPLLPHLQTLTNTSSKVITQHEPYELIFEDTNLGIQRTEKLILIQIFQQGRNADQKQAIYATLAERLESECGVPKTDLVVSCSANTKEDWSFG
ncbi:hypothetical protein KCU73_g2420, partial [Aureobasidium melanogenum]